MAADLCPQCTTAFKVRASFCAACGFRRPAHADVGLRFALSLYFLLLVTNLVGVIYVRLDGAPFTAEVAVTIAFAVITLAFATLRWPLLAPLVKTPGFGPGGYLLVTAITPIVVLLVLGYLNGLERAFGVRFPDDLASTTPHGMAVTVLLIVVAPPLIEEVAFRGLMFSGLARALTARESIIISSLAFALLHLAIASLVTHLPIGLYFCYLRYRSGSIWPGIYAHATYNGAYVLLHYLDA